MEVSSREATTGAEASCGKDACRRFATKAFDRIANLGFASQAIGCHRYAIRNKKTFG